MSGEGNAESESQRRPLIAICDLDGTLIDSDSALSDAFVALGIDRDEITFGHVLAEECDRLGIDIEDYLNAYDPTRAMPFPGVGGLVGSFDRWAVCSNKHPRSGHAELARLGWSPEVSFFADAFSGPKVLAPVLDALGVAASEVIFLGDTAHDRHCAHSVGATFALAGWNPRAVAQPGDLVLSHPLELLEFLER